MKIINTNMATFTGFFISFVAIIVNALVLANINNRIGAVDAETARLNGALREQTVNGNEAETKFQNYRMMHHLASIVSPANREDAKEDATVLLNEAITFLFAAANEVSVTEIRRTEAEETESAEVNQRYEQAKEATEESGGKKTPVKPSPNDEKQEAEKSFEAALRELENAGAAGDDELRKKIVAIDTLSSAAATAENEAEFFVRLFPVNKSLSARWVASVKQKQTKLAELETDKRRLIIYQGYSTFAALALQMLGLMFVILKDVLKIREESADRTL